MKINSNTILITVVTLLIAGGAYWYFFMNNGTEAPLAASDSIESAAQSQFQALITELPASFDTSIFSNPNFMALVDISTPIAPETSGRTDPFAPISVASSTGKSK